MMGRTAMRLPLALLFLASVISSNAQKTEVAGPAEESRVKVAAGAPLTVECRLRPEQPVEWRRDGEAPPPDLRAAPEAPAADARLAARLRAQHARAAHAGLYTCTRERDHRVRVVVLPAGEPPATEAVSALPTPAAPALAPAAADDPELPELLYDVRGEIAINCTIPNESNLKYIWHKNGTDIEAIGSMKGRYVKERGGAEFRIPQSIEDDYGNYSCAVVDRPENQTWAVRGRPYLKLPANSNVVEGQKLKLVCKVIGKPYPTVVWGYTNSSDEAANYTDVMEALGEGRVQLESSEQGVPRGVLLLPAAERTDAGRYSCYAQGAAAPAVTVLRVKDMYAALWPFLGICAEVFVLCAIILVYEKRRTKPDLDDSDTDNHDQKKS